MTRRSSPWNGPRRHQHIDRPYGELGRAITDARLRMDITLRELATEVGLGLKTVGSYGRGLTMPDHETASKLAAALESEWVLHVAWRYARTVCSNCEVEFYRIPGYSKRTPHNYCAPECRNIHQDKMAREERATSSPSRLQTAHRRINWLEDRLEVVEQAMKDAKDTFYAMCKACEWDEVCRTADCPIQVRGKSPFRLVAEEAA